MSFEHQFPFDPSYGHTLESLLQVPAPAGPADFADFWQKHYADNLQIPPDPKTRKIQPLDDRSELFEIDYQSAGGQVGGWLQVPKEPFRQAVVMGHGYGGRDTPGQIELDEPTAVISPCARGFHRSAAPDVPASSAFHVLHGVEDRETYIHRINVAELWSAFTAIELMFPQAKGRIFYFGGSFGGGLGAMMLPWEKRCRRAFLEVPSFGNQPLRLTLEMTGSGGALKLHHERRGDVLPVVQYYDAATAARYIQTPTLVAAALFDPAVPPPGQFAVYNGIRCEKKLFVKQAGHFSWEGEADEHRRMMQAVREWFVG
jgi:cephalosporin-C deacetylase